MAHRIASIWLCCILGLSVSVKLRAGSKTAVASARLRTSASRLAKVLHAQPMGIPELREVLGREADYLGAQDTLGSQLLRGFAQQAPVHLLVAPAETLEVPLADTEDQEEQEEDLSALNPAEPRMETVETTVQSDDQGGLVRRQRHCIGNLCEEQVEAAPEARQPAMDTIDASLDRLRPAMVAQSTDSLRRARERAAARRFGAELRSQMKALGEEEFSAVMRGLFGLGEPPARDDAADFALGKLAVQAEPAVHHSKSVVTQASFKNGHWVTKHITCNDGVCEAEGEANEDDQEMEDAVEGKEKAEAAEETAEETGEETEEKADEGETRAEQTEVEHAEEGAQQAKEELSEQAQEAIDKMAVKEELSEQAQAAIDKMAEKEELSEQAQEAIHKMAVKQELSEQAQAAIDKMAEKEELSEQAQAAIDKMAVKEELSEQAQASIDEVAMAAERQNVDAEASAQHSEEEEDETTAQEIEAEEVPEPKEGPEGEEKAEEGPEQFDGELAAELETVQQLLVAGLRDIEELEKVGLSEKEMKEVLAKGEELVAEAREVFDKWNENKPEDQFEKEALAEKARGVTDSLEQWTAASDPKMTDGEVEEKAEEVAEDKLEKADEASAIAPAEKAAEKEEDKTEEAAEKAVEHAEEEATEKTKETEETSETQETGEEDSLDAERDAELDAAEEALERGLEDIEKLEKLGLSDDEMGEVLTKGEELVAEGKAVMDKWKAKGEDEHEAPVEEAQGVIASLDQWNTKATAMCRTEEEMKERVAKTAAEMAEETKERA